MTQQISTVEERLQHYSMSVDDCNIWYGSMDSDGYGTMKVERKRVSTHRLAWELANGPLPEGLHVLHICGIPPCILPGHLHLGTNFDNQQASLRAGTNYKANRTHCPQGHPYNEANTYIAPGTGYRNCRTCRGQVNHAD